MMETNNDNNNENDEDQQQQQQAADAARGIRRRRRRTLHSVLDRQEEFPSRQRNKIDTLIEEFLTNLGNDIHDMLCDPNHGDDYQGLDSNRDTEAEVETAIRFFPEVLSRRGGEYDSYPIQCLPLMYDINLSLVCNVKAVSFVHVISQLAIEFGSFQQNDRGGLLVDNGDSLNSLVSSSHSSYGEGHNRTVDNVFVAEMIRLRQMGLLMREDIQEYELVSQLCAQNYFAENRFRFLVEWNPTSLTRTNRWGYPLHYSATKTLQSFRIVLDYGIRYYPMMKGISILFQKHDFSGTPIQNACKRFRRKDVIDVVEETLARYSPTTPINITYALLLAAIDERIHLDCVYFLLRRVPDVLI